jgi:nucleotide-binding universal stress UspA family protein
MALEKAVTFAGKIDPTPEVIAQNVFQIPTGYHYTGKTFEEFGEIMKKNAKKDYENFISELKLKKVKLKDIYTLDKDDDVITAIYKKAKDLKADIIIIGAKGRTATTAIFIGSKAEKMVQLDSDIPLLIIRPKGKRAGFREYLQEL